MTFSIQANTLDALIETGFFLNICNSYSTNVISEINVVCKNNVTSRLLNGKPKTANGHRLMSSYQRLASKVKITYLNTSAKIDNTLTLADKPAKFVA